VALQLRVCIDVENLETGIAFYRDALGLTPGRRLGQSWVRLAILADPSGNGFCLLEYRGRGYDEMIGGGG